MGTSRHSHHMPIDQYKILKEAGKLVGPLDKPFEKYGAFDEHELSQAFDRHLGEPPAAPAVTPDPAPEAPPAELPAPAPEATEERHMPIESEIPKHLKKGKKK